MKKLAIFLLAFLGCLASYPILAAFVGEPAPALVVKEWIKGQPVKVGAGSNIVVVEIWGTASLGSRICITNLNHLQKRFQTNGVLVVGISDEPVERIKSFLSQDVGTNVEYAIAADDGRQTAKAYMLPIKQHGIPYAFVVGTNGEVLWHGPPFAGLDRALNQIVAGKYDVEQVRKAEQAAEQIQQYLTLARSGDFRAAAAGKLLLANRTNDVGLLCDMAYQIATAPRLKKRDFELSGQALDQAEKLAVTNKAQVMITRAVWLFTSGKEQDGMLLATQALAAAHSPWASNSVQTLLHSMQAHRSSKTGESPVSQRENPAIGGDTLAAKPGAVENAVTGKP